MQALDHRRHALPHADAIQADLILSTDPDADRIGIMVNHHGAWEFLNGNEIGILLTHYGIRQFKARGTLQPESTIIKTDVTTALIARIAQTHRVQCIGDLLVGFKYIGEEMNRLEAEGRLEGFILGTEESHGFLMGNYARDKDAAGAAVWLVAMGRYHRFQRRILADPELRRRLDDERVITLRREAVYRGWLVLVVAVALGVVVAPFVELPDQAVLLTLLLHPLRDLEPAGAVAWLAQQEKGLFDMQDVLGLR